MELTFRAVATGTPVMLQCYNCNMIDRLHYAVLQLAYAL